MPLQDLTPQLRTRLSRVERIVGWFVVVSTLLLLVGFGFYLYTTAKNRGWFVTKLNYATAINDVTGFKIGDPVKLMGYDVGQISEINLNSPEKAHGITIFFNVREPFYGYIWYDSHVRLTSDLLGNRFIEITKGQNGAISAITNKETGKLMVLNRYLAWQKYKAVTNELFLTNKDLSTDSLLIEATNQLTEVITNHINDFYTNAFDANYNKTPNPDPKLPPETRNYYYIPAIDTPSVQDRLNSIAASVQIALPDILAMTNQLAAILSNSQSTVARLNTALAKADPIIDNMAAVTEHLRDPNGSLGKWLLPTNLAEHLDQTVLTANETLQSAHVTMDDADTNIIKLADDLDHTLQHLADLTGSLNSQVQANTNIVSEISATIVHTDDLVQGLKREWFLRGAFKTKKPKPTSSTMTHK